MSYEMKTNLNFILDGTIFLFVRDSDMLCIPWHTKADSIEISLFLVQAYSLSMQSPREPEVAC